jgi:hypothetical protein
MIDVIIIRVGFFLGEFNLSFVFFFKKAVF